MHGSLLYGFKQYVIKGHGIDSWNSVVDLAGAGGWYHSTKSYDDAEFLKLVEAAATIHGVSVPQVLEDFGEALVPTLLSLYGAFVLPSWRTLDLLVHAETVIHRSIRHADHRAAPPALVVRRVSPHEVHIEYSSNRRLCSVAVGICRGVGEHYGEKVLVKHPECVRSGASLCLLVVVLQERAAEPRRQLAGAT